MCVCVYYVCIMCVCLFMYRCKFKGVCMPILWGGGGGGGLAAVRMILDSL